MKNTSVRRLCEAGLIGALYVALTLLLQPLSFGPLQVRLAEVLTILPVLTPAAVPGLAVGCAASNALCIAANPAGAWDILFGSAVAESIYGEGNIGIVMLMGAFAVPFFNALAVILLEIGRNSTASPKKLLKSICKNQIVLAAVIALAMKLVHLELPAMAEDVCFDLAGLATPLSFLSLGVSLDVQAIGRNRRPLVLGICTRLLLIPAIFVGGAVALGFRAQELCAIFLLFAAPTAVSSYPLAVSMDADPELAGQMVIFTTVCCLPTFFLWVMAMSSFGLF